MSIMLKPNRSLNSIKYHVLPMMLAMGLLGCGKPINDKVTPTESLEQKVKSNLIVANYKATMDADYPPYSYRNEKGEAIGFDVDMLHSIGQVEGFTVDIEPNLWSTIIPSVGQSQYAIGLGGIAKSDIKEVNMTEQLLISEPYKYGRDAIAIQANNKLINLSILDNFEKLKDLRISTIENTGYMIDIKHIKNNQIEGIITEPTTFLAYKNLFNGKADVVLADRGVLQYLQKNNPTFPITIGGRGEYFDDPYGMVYVIDKHQPQLQAKINHGIKTLVANGTFNQLHIKWFGAPAVYIPGKMSDNNLAATAINLSK